MKPLFVERHPDRHSLLVTVILHVLVAADDLADGIGVRHLRIFLGRRVGVHGAEHKCRELEQAARQRFNCAKPLAVLVQQLKLKLVGLGNAVVQILRAVKLHRHHARRVLVVERSLRRLQRRDRAGGALLRQQCPALGRLLEHLIGRAGGQLFDQRRLAAAQRQLRAAVLERQAEALRLRRTLAAERVGQLAVLDLVADQRQAEGEGRVVLIRRVADALRDRKRAVPQPVDEKRHLVAVRRRPRGVPNAALASAVRAALLARFPRAAAAFAGQIPRGRVHIAHRQAQRAVAVVNHRDRIAEDIVRVDHARVLAALLTHKVIEGPAGVLLAVAQRAEADPAVGNAVRAVDHFPFAVEKIKAEFAVAQRAPFQRFPGPQRQRALRAVPVFEARKSVKLRVRIAVPVANIAAHRAVALIVRRDAGYIVVCVVGIARPFAVDLTNIIVEGHPVVSLCVPDAAEADTAVRAVTAVGDRTRRQVEKLKQELPGGHLAAFQRFGRAQRRKAV